jgi:hypothetical protein
MKLDRSGWPGLLPAPSINVIEKHPVPSTGSRYAAQRIDASLRRGRGNRMADRLFATLATPLTRRWLGAILRPERVAEEVLEAGAVFGGTAKRRGSMHLGAVEPGASRITGSAPSTSSGSRRVSVIGKAEAAAPRARRRAADRLGQAGAEWPLKVGA